MVSEDTLFALAMLIIAIIGVAFTINALANYKEPPLPEGCNLSLNLTETRERTGFIMAGKVPMYYKKTDNYCDLVCDNGNVSLKYEIC